MNTKPRNKLLSLLAPILGAGAVGVCPICWIGSASLLTYLGLGALIPVWRGIILALLGFALLGFILDFRFHKNPIPLIILTTGAILLYFGRYVYGGPGFTGWEIWGVGAILIIVAVVRNKKEFKMGAR